MPIERPVTESLSVLTTDPKDQSRYKAGIIDSEKIRQERYNKERKEELISEFDSIIRRVTDNTWENGTVNIKMKDFTLRFGDEEVKLINKFSEMLKPRVELCQVQIETQREKTPGRIESLMTTFSLQGDEVQKRTLNLGSWRQKELAAAKIGIKELEILVNVMRSPHLATTEDLERLIEPEYEGKQDLSPLEVIIRWT